MDNPRLQHVRRMGALGRVVLPTDMRESLSLETGDTIKIELYDDHIIVRPASSKTESDAVRDVLRRLLAGHMSVDTAAHTINGLMTQRKRHGQRTAR